MTKSLLLLFLAAVGACAAQIKTLPITGLRNPYGLTLGPDGALYVCDIDQHVVWRFKDNEARIFAGSGRRGYSGDGGPATRAELNEPYEVRFDARGNMFFVEMRNAVIRRVAKDGTVSTFAGTGQAGFAGDGGPATKAQFNQPHSVQFDAQGNLYVCDIGNQRIRKIDTEGKITTFAGTGERQPTPDGANFATAPLNGPRAIDFDRDGNMWLALREGNAIYRLDLKEGTIHHVAGTGASGHQDGAAKSALLSGPKGISVGPKGIFFADTESHTIRYLISEKNMVATVAGVGHRADGPDGISFKCGLARPHGIFVAPDGVIYVGDSENNKVRVISP